MTLHIIIHRNTVYAEIFAKRKVSPILPSALNGEIFYHANFLSCVIDHIHRGYGNLYRIDENLFHRIFTVAAKIKFT